MERSMESRASKTDCTVAGFAPPSTMRRAARLSDMLAVSSFRSRSVLDGPWRGTRSGSG